MAGKGCALHHWVHDVVFNVSNQLVILTAYVLTRVSSILVGIIPIYIHLQSYLRTAISNFGLSLGRSSGSEESSSARDSSYVGGLAPWALRRDLETSRAQARLTEAELSTNQTEIALLKSKNKLGEKERELLNHDLENVERALGNVLERVSVLESGENATLKKRLVETETKLGWACMQRDIAERRLHESQVWNKMFYLDMVRIGAVLKPPSDDEDTKRPRKKSKNSTSDGTEGPSEPRGPPSDS
ncbi:hypothetical protein Tco_0805799 [Tanacetum coccineum]